MMIKSNIIQYRKPNYQTEYFYIEPDDGDVYWHVSEATGKHTKPRNQDAIDYMLKVSLNHNCVWDFGANIGVMGVHLMRYYHHVVCVEPHPEVFQALVKTMCSPINHVPGHSFECLNVGVGDQSGKLYMQDYGQSQLRRILKPNEEGKKPSVPVEIVTGDSLLAKCPPPDFIKIDVESFEWFVVQGLKQTIDQYRPSFMIEIEDQKFELWNHTSDELFEFFHQRQYVAQDKLGRTWKSRNDKSMWVSDTRRGFRDFYFVHVDVLRAINEKASDINTLFNL